MNIALLAAHRTQEVQRLLQVLCQVLATMSPEGTSRSGAQNLVVGWELELQEGLDQEACRVDQMVEA